MAAAHDGPSPRYDLADHERAWLADGSDLSERVAAEYALDVDVSQHAVEQHRARQPDAATASIGAALAAATRDADITYHPFFAQHNIATDGVYAYAGRLSRSQVYRMVFPVADGVVTTAYRVRSVPRHAERFGHGADVGWRLKSYLVTLADQGGILDE